MIALWYKSAGQMFPPGNAINILVIYIEVAGDETCLKHRCVRGSNPGGSRGSSAGMPSAQRLALAVGQDLLLLAGPFILCYKVPACNRCPDM